MCNRDVEREWKEGKREGSQNANYALYMFVHVHVCVHVHVYARARVRGYAHASVCSKVCWYAQERQSDQKRAGWSVEREGVHPGKIEERRVCQEGEVECDLSQKWALCVAQYGVHVQPYEAQAGQIVGGECVCSRDVEREWKEGRREESQNAKYAMYMACMYAVWHETMYRAGAWQYGK